MIHKRSQARSVWALIAVIVSIYMPITGTETIAVRLTEKKAEGETRARQARSFDIGSYTVSTVGGGGAIFLGARAGEGGLVGEYALSRLYPTQDALDPITPEEVTLDKTWVPRDNPLFNQGILHLAVMTANEEVQGDSERPVVVTRDNPRTMYLLNNISDMQTRVFSAPTIDSEGKQVGGITALAATKERVFYAARPFGGQFGDEGSSIGNVVLGFTTKQEDQEGADEKEGAFFSVLTKGTPLDRTSTQVKIDGDLKDLCVSDMCCDSATGYVYMGLKATAGKGGCKGVVVGQLEKVDGKDTHKIKLFSFGSDDIIGHPESIIGASGPGEQVSIHKVQTMYTSTALSYLIVVGGKGAPEDTRRSVFALPLATGHKEEEYRGVLAKKHATSVDFFSKNRMFYSRVRPDQAQGERDVPRASDPEVCVGGQPLPAGDVATIVVKGDAVFVTVADACEGYEPGIFYSRALIDNMGEIKGWTLWARARTSCDEQGNIDPVSGVHLDVMAGKMISIVPQGDRETVIRRTVWGTGDDGVSKPLVEAIDKVLGSQGGVYATASFNHHTPGLKDVSLQLFAGKNTIMAVEVGCVRNGILRPSRGVDFAKLREHKNGTCFGDMEAKITAITDDTLSTIGPVTAMAIGTTEQDTWIFAAGKEGVCVLCHEDGSGAGSDGIGPDGYGLSKEMRCCPFGAYRYVRKLVADDLFLYVLTDKKLDRVDLRTLTIDATCMCSAATTTLVDLSSTRNQLKGAGVLFDCAVSQALVLLGADTGLWRTDDGADVRTMNIDDQTSWMVIETPGSDLPVTHISAMSRTGRMQDLTTHQGGQVYVLTAFRGEGAYMHRFAVAPLRSDEPVSGETVALFPDLFCNNSRSYLVSFGEYRDHIASDGALFFSVRNRSLRHPTSIMLANPLYELRMGNRFIGTRSIEVPVDVAKSAAVTALSRNEATGNWFVVGDFGMRINE